MIYFDNSATTFPDREWIREYGAVLENCPGNPSSAHRIGRDSAIMLEEARKRTAAALNVSSGEVVFTGSGTESNNLAVLGAACGRSANGHIITTGAEHASVYQACLELESKGFEVTYLPSSSDGVISLNDLQEAIRENTFLVTFMHVNNETGSVQPIEDIGRLLKEHPSVIFHVDAVQSLGKIPFSIQKAGIDLLSASSHKIHSPRGTGLLYIRNGTKIQPLLRGGGQESSMRAGTENLAGIHVFSLAVEKQIAQLEANAQKLTALSAAAVRGLAGIPGVLINSPDHNWAPHILNLSIPGISSGSIVEELDKLNICVSKSSACSSRNREASRVLIHSGLPEERAKSAFRISFSTWNTLEEVEILLMGIFQIVRKHRKATL